MKVIFMCPGVSLLKYLGLCGKLVILSYMSSCVWQGTDGDPADVCAQAYTRYNNTSGRATGASAHTASDANCERKDRM